MPRNGKPSRDRTCAVPTKATSDRHRSQRKQEAASSTEIGMTQCVVDQPLELRRSASLPFGMVGMPSGWDQLPSSALSHIFDLLPPQELAAVASTCKTWHSEAVHDGRWERFWRREVGDQSLWGWAKAGGGFREQLRARAAIKKGECNATIFPLSRLEGPVVEVLMRDGSSWKRIITAQLQLSRPESVRLKGATVKVWDAAGLVSQRPLMVVHDCLKHLQLEDGRLLLWRITNDAIIRTKSLDPSDEQAVAEGVHWAEHPDILPSILDPATLTLQDVALDSRFGSGSQPYEWQDMFAGCVGCVSLERPQRRMCARIFELESGACVMQAVCEVPEVEGAPDWGDSDVSCIMSRSADPRSPLLVAAVLFDCRTFMWRLPQAPFNRPRTNQQLQHQQHLGQGHPQREGWAALAGEGGSEQLRRQQQGGGGVIAAESARGLVPMYTTVEQEPIVDVSVSTASGRMFIVGMENIYVLGLDGSPMMIVNMAQWRGVATLDDMAPLDVGAFSWPLPSSSKAAFYVDCSSSLYIAEFRRPQLSDFMLMHNSQRLAGDGRHPQFDNLLALNAETFLPNQPYYVQVHSDLRPSQPGNNTLLGGRAVSKAGCPQEPVIVEYPQEGSTVFTVGDSSCPAVAKLLKLEKDEGTYLQGLGPASVSSSRSSRGGGKRVVTGGNGGGTKMPVAPRAIVCIDSATGCRYKAIPIEGVVEAIHSCGQYLVVAVAGRESYPEDTRGALVVLDFTKHPAGFWGQMPATRQQPQQHEQAQVTPSKGPGEGVEEGGPSSRAAVQRGKRDGQEKSGDESTRTRRSARQKGKRGRAELGESSSAAASKKRAKRK